METKTVQPATVQPAEGADVGGRRQRNARGEGSRLTDDIVQGALALIDRTNGAEAVTLRAVAREVGIAAPSIYAHFADRDAIVLAVTARLFADLAATTRAAGEAAPDDPVERLVAGCQEYVRYGLENQARYRVLFSGALHESASEYCPPEAIGPDGRPVLEVGAEAFPVLEHAIQECAEAGLSASTDVFADSTAVWVGLHGTVTLRATLPGFPWPEPIEDFVRQLVLRLAKVTRPAQASAPAVDETG
jgi:AcrR family transcriptional regulator